MPRARIPTLGTDNSKKQLFEIVNDGRNEVDGIAHDLKNIGSIAQAVSVGEHYFHNRLNIHIHFRWLLCGVDHEADEFCAIFQRLPMRVDDSSNDVLLTDPDRHLGVVEHLLDGGEYAVFRDVVEFRQSPQDRPAWIESLVWLQFLHLCNGDLPDKWGDFARSRTETRSVAMNKKAQLPQRLQLASGAPRGREPVSERELVGEIIQRRPQRMDHLTDGDPQIWRWIHYLDNDVVGLPVRLSFDGREVACYFRKLSSREELLEIINVLIRPINPGADVG